MKQKSFLLYFFLYLFFYSVILFSVRLEASSKEQFVQKNDEITIPSILNNLKEFINQQESIIKQIDYILPEYQTLLEANIGDMLEIITILENRHDLDFDSLVEVQDSIEILSQFLSNYDSLENFKAPRPNAPSVNDPSAVVGKNGCDLTQVLALLSAIKKRIELLKELICEKFAFTWTILEDIKITLTEDIFDTQTILCAKFDGTFSVLQEIELDLSGVFTAIADIDVSVTIGELTVSVFIDLSGVFTSLENICEKLEATFTVLNEIEEDIFDTRTIVCEKLAGTFTVLDEIEEDIFDTKTILCDKFNGTFTTLQEIELDISGVFTAIDALTFTVEVDLSGVFTVLDEIEEDIFDTRTIICEKLAGTFTVLDEIEEDIFDTKTVLCEKLAGTFTVLQEIETDISGVFTAIDALTFTVEVDLSGVFTVLEEIEEDIFDTRTIICEKLAGTFTVLDEIEEDIFDTRTIICEKLAGTFTVLQEIETDISGVFTAIDALTFTVEVDLSGVFTVLEEIEEDIFDTRTIICEKLAGTFTVLDEIEEDIFDTKTVLCEKLAGTFTVLQEIETDISGVFTAIDALTFTVEVDLSGVFTVLDEIEEDIFDTKTVLCEKLAGTFTVLQEIELDISGVFTVLEDFEVSVTVDLSGVFTALNFICDKIESNDEVILSALCTPTVIQQVDVDTTTFVIDTPGYYVFGEDIEFNPASAQPAIAITSDNVMVEMCGKTLQQGNSVAGVDGFRIVGDAAATPRSNVTIFNGTVRDFTRAGMTVGTNSITPANTACEIITLKDLNIVACEIRGIEFLGSSGASIEKSVIDNCSILSCCTDSMADDALRLEFVECTKIKNSQINENGAASVDLVSVNILTSTQINIESVDVVCNTAQTFIGFAINGSINSLLENCLVKNNTATDDLTGFIITGGPNIQGNVLGSCATNNNTSTNGPLTGFELLPFVTRNILRDCLASNNLVTGAVATANCFGLNFDQPTFCSILNCRAENNRATGDGTTNICAGFNVSTSGVGTTGTKNCEFSNNRATSNNGFNDTRSFGIRAVSLANGNTNNLYTFNIAARNGPSSPINNNQIVDTAGMGSNPGGVPAGTVRDRTITNLNFNVDYGNLRIV